MDREAGIVFEVDLFTQDVILGLQDASADFIPATIVCAWLLGAKESARLLVVSEHFQKAFGMSTSQRRR